MANQPLTARQLREILEKLGDDTPVTFEGNDTYFYAGKASLSGLVTLSPCPDETED